MNKSEITAIGYKCFKIKIFPDDFISEFQSVLSMLKYV